MSKMNVGEKFVPAFFLDVVERGEVFEPGNWPLHITTFPPILHHYDEQFGEDMRALINPFSPFVVRVGGNDLFGPDRDLPVKRIEPSLPLQGLHYMLIKAVGNLLHDPTYRQPYNPHISVEDYDQVPTGTELEIGGISLVEKQTSGLWTVVDKVGLRGKHETTS